MASPDKEMASLRELLTKLIEGKVEANRRYVDEILVRLQESNHRYYLEKFLIEVHRMELEEQAGNAHNAFCHKVMAETYKGILERAFGVTDVE